MLSARFALEVLLLGGVLVWLMALVPAAVICVRKREWAGFLAGWLSFGLAWVVCAAALMPRRHAARALLLSAGAIVVVGALAARPAPIVGVSGNALESSVDGSDLLSESEPCEHLQASVWRCGRYDHDLSSDVPYRVEVDGLGCWEARREWRRSEVGAVRYVGCVSLIDELL